MPFGIEQYVLGLQISICHSLGFMQILEDKNDFTNIESCSRFGKAFGFPKIREYFATRAVVELRSDE